MDDQVQMALSPQQPFGGQRVRRITGLWKRKHKKTTGQTYKERLKDNILTFGAINVATLRGKEEDMVELMKLRQLTVLGERISKYNTNVGMMYPLLKDRHVPRQSKMIIYKTILKPILLYGAETWSLTTKTQSKLQAAEMRVLRLIKGVT